MEIKTSTNNLHSGNYGAVWILVRCVHVWCNARFSFFFFSFNRICWLFNHELCIRALFTDPQISLFNNFFIKNGSHDTIHTLKNYFAIVFSVFNFQFQQNKFYSNVPYIPIFGWMHEHNLASLLHFKQPIKAISVPRIFVMLLMSCT